MSGVYRRGDRWRASFEFVAGDGQRVQRTKSFRTRREASQWRVQSLADLSRFGPASDPARLMFEAWVEEWLTIRHLEGLAASTLEAHRSTISLYATGLYGRRLSDISSRDIDRVIAAMTGRISRKGIVLSPSTVIRFRATISKLFADAEKRGMISKNPVPASTRPKAKKPEPEAWTLDQLRAFQNWLDTAGLGGGRHRHADVLHLVAWTGLRWGEIIALNWRDVDIESGCLTVEEAWSRTESAMKDTKTKAGQRVVALDAATVAILESHRSAQGRARISTVGWLGGDAVFVGPDTDRLSYGGVPQALDRLQTRFRRDIDAALPRITLKGLRSTHATVYSQTGASPREIAERLGHADAGQTAQQFYVKADLDHQRTLLRKLTEWHLDADAPS